MRRKPGCDTTGVGIRRLRALLQQVDEEKEATPMGLLGKLTKAGVAKKVIDEGRKPENQRRIKSLVSNLTSKNKGGSSPGGTTRY
jgi:hypothetical protein